MTFLSDSSTWTVDLVAVAATAVADLNIDHHSVVVADDVAVVAGVPPLIDIY
eukprot:CAMPEP_0203737182 /NCGR_PEP_ID=MMETSP0092-20131115/38231_1 /ASSEMBLY_ACC=CAM_ASM_001090 /TAXON_ID=426623 /ORGANISM="Chaetoceros affinis, Strain CCMP159" /LENGTH=51 /DNA_ID=CAMNT_0050622387 /DNA_START=425 /DNA_END=577 /DNA_ORIENTATION=+